MQTRGKFLGLAYLRADLLNVLVLGCHFGHSHGVSRAASGGGQLLRVSENCSNMVGQVIRFEAPSMCAFDAYRRVSKARLEDRSAW